MPIYQDLPSVRYYPSPEKFLRLLLIGQQYESVLDVGSGMGGVLDYDGWNKNLNIKKKEACDLFWIREMDSSWNTKKGVDVEKLNEYYEDKSFDVVMCIETLEHVNDTEKAIANLCRVAKKFVFITSSDETQHIGEGQETFEQLNAHQKYIAQPSIEYLKSIGFSVCVDDIDKRQIIAWKYFC